MSRRPPWLLALLLGAGPAAAARVEYGLAARTEARIRSPLPGDATGNTSGDLAFEPTLGLRVTAGAGEFTAGYLPSLTVRDLAWGPLVLPLHRARLGARWTTAGVMARLDQEGSLGVLSLGPLRDETGAPASGQVGDATTTGLLPYLRSVSTAAVDVTLGRDLHLLGDLAWQASGGQTAEAQRQLPLQWGPAGQVQVKWLASRRDTLLASLSGRHAEFSSGQVQTIAQLTGDWLARFDRTWSLDLTAGGAFTWQRVPATLDAPAASHANPQPVGAATLTALWPVQGWTLGGSARLRLAPYADRFTGTVWERAEGQLALTGTWAKPWLATLTGGAAQGVPLGSPVLSPDRLLSLEGNVGWTPLSWLQLMAFVRVARTERPGTDTAATTYWAGGLALTVRETLEQAW